MGLGRCVVGGGVQVPGVRKGWALRPAASRAMRLGPVVQRARVLPRSGGTGPPHTRSPGVEAMSVGEPGVGPRPRLCYRVPPQLPQAPSFLSVGPSLHQ